MFSDYYINQFAFKQDEILENSFEIFVKTPGYDSRLKKIDELVGAIKDTFKESVELDQVIADLTTLSESFGKSKTGYSESGALAKGLGKGNRLANIPKGLESYSDYLKCSSNVKWLRWQMEGNSYSSISSNCPYCTSSTEDKKETISLVAKEYDPKSIEHLNKILNVLDGLGNYFSPDAKEKIHRIANNASGLGKEEKNYLLRIKEQVETLKSKMLDLKGITYYSMRDAEKVSDFITKLKINLEYLPELNSTHTQELVERLNESLNTVLAQVGILQGEIAQQNQLIKRTIEENSKEINNFLMVAGYKYFVDAAYSNESYKMRLRHKEYSEAVSNGGQHLSYGEKNAFALILFMYECLSKNPDLIILDDPISSFDRNKKYAVLDMLFHGGNSLRGKTVLMMTHDLEPIIDIIYNLSRRFSPLPRADFIVTDNGMMTELPITKADIATFGRICDENIANRQEDVVKLVYLRRYFEILDNKGNAYQLLSNLLHKRSTPITKRDANEISMTISEIESATREIKKKLPGFDYSQLLVKLTDIAYMRAAYFGASFNYEKLQIFRILQDSYPHNDIINKFINEAFHIENEYVMQINPCKYEIVPSYIIEECDKVLLAG